MENLIGDIKKTIEKYEMLRPGDKLVAGVSGGPDSLCMLHVLKSLCGEYGFSLYAAHLNHQFRGEEADADAFFVGEICRSWGIPVFIKVFDVPSYIEETGLSPEDAARKIRYSFFDRVCENVGANKIAVAQNLNDHAETILMRLIRGSGIDGLKGIEAVRGNIIRPLLEIERFRIERYCIENDLIPRLDRTNLEPIYQRNKVRLELIPYIEKNFNPSIIIALNRFSDLIREENDYIKNEADAAFQKITESLKDRMVVDVPQLAALHVALRRRVVRQCVEKLLNNLDGFEFKHFEGVLGLTQKPTGASLMLPCSIKAYISYDRLILAKCIVKADEKCYYNLKCDCASSSIDTAYGHITVERKKAGEIDELKGRKDSIYIDASGIKEGLVLRHRQPGDVFSPIGMKGTKKLKDYFIDEKVPKEKRDGIEIIADGNEVVWIVGGRLSEKYKVTGDTDDVLLIKYRRESAQC